MSILDNTIILSLIVGAFIAGMKIADKYHREARQEIKTALQRQFLRLQTDMDADDPVQPYQSPFSVPPEFEERLRENGSATMAVR